MAFAILLKENFDGSTLNLLEQLADLPGGLVTIFHDFDHVCRLKKFKGLLDVISKKKITPLDTRGKNENIIKSEIQKHISNKIFNADASHLKIISDCAVIAQKIGIKVDEYNNECQVGHTLTKDIISILNSVPVYEVKRNFLSLQGSELWHKLAKYDKESYQTANKGNVTVPYYNEKRLIIIELCR